MLQVRIPLRNVEVGMARLDKFGLGRNTEYVSAPAQLAFGGKRLYGSGSQMSFSRSWETG